jgi:carbonic anhydrase
MKERKISQEKIDLVQNAGIDINEWLHGFKNTETSIIKTVEIIKIHPLIPSDVNVYGLIIDPKTGQLTRLV